MCLDHVRRQIDINRYTQRGTKMERNTKDIGLNMISVKRNPYLEEYGNDIKRRNVSSNRAGNPMRGQGSNRTQAWRNAGQRAALSDPRRVRAARRKQRLQIQVIAVALGLVTLAVLGVGLIVKNHRAAAAAGLGGTQKEAMGSGANVGAGNSTGMDNVIGVNNPGQPAGVMIQGLPAEKFAAHPDWEENFLTPNEYSRPGDALTEIKNIFVHYTANPGTSAAQNRSYFERQKDEHLASVSSHFIIGYDGEIIQCVPLTEIAYAVQTRNFDSISIECCYKAKDGSFTQETYHSLISLLAWLTDVYGLDTEDILRHYDCGGKKCPLYYTDHADKWKQLKEDVKQMKENTGVKL